MSGATVGRDAQSGHGGLYCVAWKSGREAATYRRPYPHATPYPTIRDIAEGWCAAQRRAELYPFRSTTPTTGIPAQTYTYRRHRSVPKCTRTARRDSDTGKGHSHGLCRSTFREIHMENCPPMASSRPVCRVNMRETLMKVPYRHGRVSPGCAFALCAAVAAAALAGGPGCGLVGGCVADRFGAAPRPRPKVAVRRRQRPQVRLFGQAVGSKSQRKRDRAGGTP